MEPIEEAHTLYVASVEEWRKWLSDYGTERKYVWLIIYHRKSGMPGIHWHDAIEQALCYGWVDSKARKRDGESVYLKFTPRNQKSNWGKRNRERALRMIEKGLMTPRGQLLIDLAKSTGKWPDE